MFWMKNSSGEPSATLTMAFVAFVVTTILLIIGSFDKIVIGSYINLSPNVGEMATVLMAYMAITFGAYFKRRQDISNEGVELEKIISNEKLASPSPVNKVESSRSNRRRGLEARRLRNQAKEG